MMQRKRKPRARRNGEATLLVLEIRRQQLLLLLLIIMLLPPLPSTRRRQITMLLLPLLPIIQPQLPLRVSRRNTEQPNNDSEEYDVVTINNPAINGVVNPADATANLDYDEDEAQKKGSDDFDDDTTTGVQQRYVAAIQKQVQRG